MDLLNYDRDMTITWLQAEQSHGAFDDVPEADMDFETLNDADLLYYYESWLLADEDYVCSIVEDKLLDEISLVDNRFFSDYGVRPSELITIEWATEEPYVLIVVANIAEKLNNLDDDVKEELNVALLPEDEVADAIKEYLNQNFNIDVVID